MKSDEVTVSTLRPDTVLSPAAQELGRQLLLQLHSTALPLQLLPTNCTRISCLRQMSGLPLLHCYDSSGAAMTFTIPTLSSRKQQEPTCTVALQTSDW